ncbi:MAG TPA: hypothetical protein VER78_06120, partial [Thermoanaerobaculia bacterium]|nr:hypothetical protein [Thermoanaerobaculia bacterium]
MKSHRHTFSTRLQGSGLLTAGEILVVVLWTLLVTGPYLNLDSARSPAGSEFLGNIQTHHAWSWLTRCGPCAFWFGNSDGGWPVAADANSATLHP